jgi:dihydroorotase (multifunctional complex type)
MAEWILCIGNATLVSTNGIRHGGILAAGDKIVAILDADDMPYADTTVDAGKRLLFPGFIDSHVHLRDPGLTYKEDFASGTEAAAIGGVTTVMCMPNTSPPISDPKSFLTARSAGEGKAHVDFCLQASVSEETAGSIDALWADGPSSFEINLSDGAEGAGTTRMDDEGALLETMHQMARIGAPLGMYTGSQMITARLVAEARMHGRRSARDHARARPPVAEATGVAKAIELAYAARAKVVFREVSTARAFQLLRRAKQDRPDQISVEVTPHHLLLNDEVLDRLGTIAQIIPPIRGESDRLAAIAAVCDGTIDFIGSDHAPHAGYEKTDDAYASRNGTPGLDTLAAAMMSLAASGTVTYSDICRLLCAAPATTFGILGRKGTLSVGADADCVLIDPTLRRVVGPDMIHSKMKRCALEGQSLTGWPVLTVLRGGIIAENGNLIQRNGGRFLPGPGFRRVGHGE